MKTKILLALVASATLIIITLIGGTIFLHRGKMNNTISITGFGQRDFISDLIVWRADLTVLETDLATAYRSLKVDRTIIQNYLTNKGLQNEDISFTSINSREEFSWETGPNGKDTRIFTGYALTQTIEVKSEHVDKVEKISREITDLLEQGVRLYSRDPEYYYTELEALKHEMIMEASKEARYRAELITNQAGSDLKKLKSARLGVFQIKGQLTDEDYSWGGIYNTESKYKTATVTVRLEYILTN